MKDIISVEIELSKGSFHGFPWLAEINNSIFGTAKRFRCLPDALAWVAREVVKE